MISYKNGNTEFSGTGAELCMELSIVINKLRERFSDVTCEEWADKMLDEAYENSKLSVQEIREKFDAGKKDALKELKSLVKTLNNILESEE